MNVYSSLKYTHGGAGASLFWAIGPIVKFSDILRGDQPHINSLKLATVEVFILQK